MTLRSLKQMAYPQVLVYFWEIRFYTGCMTFEQVVSAFWTCHTCKVGVKAYLIESFKEVKHVKHKLMQS